MIDSPAIDDLLDKTRRGLAWLRRNHIRPVERNNGTVTRTSHSGHKGTAVLMSIEDRLCDVCRQPIGQYDGVYNVRLRLFTHHMNECFQKVRAAERDYSKSTKGRRRPRREALRVLFPETDGVHP